MEFFRKLWLRGKNVNPDLAFVFFLLVVALIYSYPSIAFKRPQSVHRWRQSDCASLALNYYQSGMHFFSPQTHNLTADHNTSGNHAPSEIPFGYYFIACLYKVFGYHDFIYRIVNTLIFLTGLTFLFKALHLLLKDFFWSMCITLLFFTSPVLAYYGNNFLSDSSAFAFALIAWYFFIKFYLQKQSASFYLSMFFFLLAGAYKISGLISFVPLVGIFCLEQMRILRFGIKEKLFPRFLPPAVAFSVIGLVIGSWIFYAKWYNEIHQSAYFSTTIYPLWNRPADEVKAVTAAVRDLWMPQYFSVYTLCFFAAVFCVNLFLIKKANRFLMWCNMLILVVAVLYVLLEFGTFRNHDYYTINVFIVLIFILINTGWILKTHYPRLFASPYLRFLFFAFFVFNIFHAKAELRARYKGWWTEHNEYKDYDTVTPYLRSIGITPSDTVICLPDFSHFTLYLMNQKGWTECWDNNHDSAGIASSIQRGAKYLIINGDEVKQRKYLQHFLQHPAGKYHDISIYKVR